MDVAIVVGTKDADDVCCEFSTDDKFSERNSAHGWTRVRTFDLSADSVSYQDFVDQICFFLDHTFVDEKVEARVCIRRVSCETTTKKTITAEDVVGGDENLSIESTKGSNRASNARSTPWANTIDEDSEFDQDDYDDNDDDDGESTRELANASSSSSTMWTSAPITTTSWADDVDEYYANLERTEENIALQRRRNSVGKSPTGKFSRIVARPDVERRSHCNAAPDTYYLLDTAGAEFGTADSSTYYLGRVAVACVHLGRIVETHVSELELPPIRSVGQRVRERWDRERDAETSGHGMRFTQRGITIHAALAAVLDVKKRYGKGAAYAIGPPNVDRSSSADLVMRFINETGLNGSRLPMDSKRWNASTTRIRKVNSCPVGACVYGGRNPTQALNECCRLMQRYFVARSTKTSTRPR